MTKWPEGKFKSNKIKSNEITIIELIYFNSFIASLFVWYEHGELFPETSDKVNKTSLSLALSLLVDNIHCRWKHSCKQNAFAMNCDTIAHNEERKKNTALAINALYKWRTKQITTKKWGRTRANKMNINKRKWIMRGFIELILAKLTVVRCGESNKITYKQTIISKQRKLYSRNPIINRRD